jgi:flagellar motor switch protein FliN/FliY
MEQAMSRNRPKPKRQVSEDDWAAAMGEQAAVDMHGGRHRRPRSDFRAAFRPGHRQSRHKGFDMILDIPVHLTVELGRTKISIRNLLQLAHGSVVELDGLAGEPMDVLVNGTLIAQGEVVVVNEKFGIRLTDIITPSGAHPQTESLTGGTPQAAAPSPGEGFPDWLRKVTQRK